MIPHTPEERRTLIGEYVLGLLDDADAREVRELIEQDQDAARMALEWEHHFLDLSDQLPPQTPSPALWARLQRSLGLAADPAPTGAWSQWWNSLLTWRL
ncbi:MAG TPA: anti-sigma factor, partial [Pseudomonas sp.]|nr:anti-sigma factor [Pseudomonas sp.]